MTLEPQSLEPQSLEPRSLEPQSLEPQSLEPRSLEPRSLVMTPLHCFYCGSNDDDIFHTEIQYLFGIKHCDKHKAAAKRDCNAYMHRNHIVDMRDAMVMPVMAPLFNQRSFTVTRTNGVLDEGWRLREGTHYDTQHMCVLKDEWHVPIYKGELVKCVPIKKLLNTEDASTVIAALEAGVYAADAGKAAAPVADPSCIGLAVCDGVVCRVFNG